MDIPTPYSSLPSQNSAFKPYNSKLKKLNEVSTAPHIFNIIKLHDQYTVHFNYPINNLPKFIEQIYFVEFSKFNYPIDSLANLNYLTDIKFPDEFSQPVNCLPKSLERIKFGNNFNQQIDLLPDSIIYLYLGKKFNKQINKLPNELEELEFDLDSEFDRPVELNNKIRKIIFPNKFNQLVKLTGNLKYLKLTEIIKFKV